MTPEKIYKRLMKEHVTLDITQHGQIDFVYCQTLTRGYKEIKTLIYNPEEGHIGPITYGELKNIIANATRQGAQLELRD